MSLEAVLEKNALDGEDIQLKVDYCVLNNAKSLETVELIKSEHKQVLHPEHIYVIQDQVIPPNSPKSSQHQQELAAFAKSNGTEYYYGTAMSAHLLVTKVRAGDVVVGTDSDIMMVGAVGALGLPECSSKLAQAVVYGKITIIPPRIIRVCLTGKLPNGTDMRDAARKLVALLKEKVTFDTIVELENSADVNLAQRMIVCGYLQKLEIKTALFTAESEEKPDYILDLSMIRTSMGTVAEVCAAILKEEKVHAVFVGGAYGGYLEDIKQVAEAVNNKKVAYKLRLTVAPATSDIYIAAANAGYLKSIIDAGGLVINQCGNPAVQGMIGAEELLISNDIHNETGYAGYDKSRIYLTSTYTAVQAAITGKVGGGW